MIIALFQLRDQNRLRQISMVMNLFSTFGQESFLHHYRRVTTWQYAKYQDFQKEATEDDYVSLMVVSSFFENMGLLYKRRLAPLDLIDDLLSAPIIQSWHKAGPILVGMRAESGPQWAEWYELLYNAMAERLARLEQKHPTR